MSRTTTSLSTAILSPRHLAAAMDNVLAMILAVFAAKSIDDGRPILQSWHSSSCFLGYSWCSELPFFLGRR